MSRTTTGILILVIFIGNQQLTSAFDAISSLKDCVTWSQILVSGDWFGAASQILGAGDSGENEVITKLNDAEKQMNDMASMLRGRVDKVMATVIKRVPKKVKLNSLFLKLHTYVIRIESLWRTFKALKKNIKGFNKDTIKDFIQACISSQGDSLRNVLEYMNELVAPLVSAAFEDGLWAAWSSDVMDYTWDEQCNQTVSIQYKMFTVHKIMMKMEMEGVQMQIFCYAMQMVYNNQTYEGEMKYMIEQFNSRAQRYLVAAKTTMNEKSREILLCDPSEHKYDETSTSLEHLFWAILMREDAAMMNKDCSYSCAETHFDWATGANEYRFIAGKRCPGYVYDCESIGNVKFCPTMYEEAYYSSMTIHDQRYGADSCEISEREIRSESTWAHTCRPCLCTCAGEYNYGDEQKAISLMPAVTDLSKNEVLVGIAWDKKSRMVRPRVEAAQLGPSGDILNGTRRWVDLHWALYDSEQRPKGAYVLWNPADDSMKPLTEKEDWAFFGKDHNTIYLDDIYVGRNCVVTGVKFACVSDECEEVRMLARATPYDFQSGKLYPDEGDTKSVWISSDAMSPRSPLYDEEREKITIVEPDVPTKCAENLPISHTNQAIDFTRTDIKKDLGQHTVPYFEISEVSSARAASEGIGLYYKGAENCGGFLAFKLIGINFSEHIEVASIEGDTDKSSEDDY